MAVDDKAHPLESKWQVRVNTFQFRTRIDIKRRMLGLNWTQLATLIGCSERVLYRLRQGHLPHVETFVHLLRWSNGTLEEILEDDPN